MIEKLIALLERFVTAHEKLAESQEAILRVTDVRIAEYPKPEPDAKPTAPAPQPEPVKVEDSAPVATAAAWNPYLEPIQGRYGKDKGEILDAEIAKRGITIKASATGPEKHQALLDDAELANKLNEPDAPASTPVQEPAAIAAPVTTDITIEVVRALAQKAMTGANKLDAKAVQDLFETHAGVRRLPEIPADKLGAVYSALTKAVGA